MSKMNRSVAVEPAPWSARLLVLTLFALLGIGCAWPAHAQAPAGDPPDRVARVSDESGQVWLYSPDDNEWVALDRNRPLTTGDRIATDNDARAKISLGTTTLRLDAATELEIVQLDDSTYRVHLHGGSVAAQLRSPQSLAEFTLETDEGQFRVQAVGRYRFDRFDQASDLTVYAGQAVFEGRNSALPLMAGQHAQFWLDASGAPQYNMVEPARDAFAAWNDDRDRVENQPVAAVRYVSPEMTGGDDLDRYGQWEQSPDYGPLWTPANVAVDWAPYSAGRWAWVRPWGWTWVDAAPWGFAPFHYGRWVNYRNRWCWAPGTYVARPVYAPALVAWIGGPRVGVSLSIGAGGPPVGWFPLAPHEVYVPSYRTSPRYVREINITHVTNVTNITTIVNNVNGAGDRREFANRKYPNAVTVVPAGVLTARQPVGPAAAQFRGNPQVRALVADGRTGSALTAAPVATPAARPRSPDGQGPIVRPPFQGRAPGLPPAPRAGTNEGRPALDLRRPDSRAGERPNGVPGTGVTPAPATGATPRAIPPPPSGRPLPTGAPQETGRSEVARPAPVVRPNGQTIERPPVPGRILREPGAEANAPRVVVPPSPVQRAAPTVEGMRPQIAPRGEPGAGRLGDPRGAETQRAVPARPAEAVRPVEAGRSGEPPRLVEPPRAAPEQHVQRPESAHRDERAQEKRDPKDPPK
jgi:hypothetical protein